MLYVISRLRHQSLDPALIPPKTSCCFARAAHSLHRLLHPPLKLATDMDESSLESNGADVASREDLSLFDEEILFDRNPNDAYFRHLVGDGDNNAVIENEAADVSLQDWMETPVN